MTDETSLMANYVDLFAFICTKREIEADKLKVLETKAKCLYAKTNKEEALNLQFEIRASKAFLDRCGAFCLEIGEKYKRLALTFSNPDCVIFSLLFFEGKSPKATALELGFSTEYIYKKKCLFTKMISEKLGDYKIPKMENEENSCKKSISD